MLTLSLVNVSLIELASSFPAQATVDVDALFEGIDFSHLITRARFESMSEALFAKTLQPVEQVRRLKFTFFQTRCSSRVSCSAVGQLDVSSALIL